MIDDGTHIVRIILYIACAVFAVLALFHAVRGDYWKDRRLPYPLNVIDMQDSTTRTVNRWGPVCIVGLILLIGLGITFYIIEGAH